MNAHDPTTDAIPDVGDATDVPDQQAAGGLPVVDTTVARPADDDLRPGIEALLFLADEPLDAVAIAEVVDRDVAEVETLLSELQAAYAAAPGGIEVRQVAGGWRMYTAPAARPVLERWALAGRTGRLTQAALETLAVVAYKQPISRSEVGEIRGVSADGAVRSLVARGFVTEVGRDEGPGQAVLYGTTTLFLERLGLQSLDQLPPLTDFLPEAPAPDEPEPGTFRDVRRRLAGGDELPVRGVFEGRRTNTGGEDETADDDDEAMPAPTTAVGAGRGGGDIDELTDRLEQAARNAVDRLRQAVAAGDEADDRDGDDAPDDPADRGPRDDTDGNG
ncbi:SMC-Scp complex subunit ScpB [Egicoccus sp. AB-alg6-2]|uniref:SMC-Scp complex subunit ScpB n=1 Tax=Egicoccus sp. AB-alg6-2 TaxID=3242692 RepID=UPI00359EA7D7